MFETGHFGVEWAEVATRLGLKVDLVPGEGRLGSDEAQSYKAVAVLHNETSIVAPTHVPSVRRGGVEAAMRILEASPPPGP
jgi:alanine-glyoxylate transaminase/serine-glyoxylate transaminase/serine-pyruvate transaminase